MVSQKTEKLLKKKIDRLDKFISETKKANQIIPNVNKALEEARWVYDTIDKAPPQAVKKLENEKFQDIIENDSNFWKNSLPTFKIYTNPIISYGSAASTTTTQMLFTQILNINAVSGSSQHSDTYQWAHDSINNYKNLQSNFKKVEDTRALLNKISTKLGEEFNEANLSIVKARRGLLSPKDAANSMRNVLNHYQGELLRLAKKNPGENVSKSQTWAVISERFALSSSAGFTRDLLLNKGQDHKAICDELTPILKNTSLEALDKLETIYVKWLDHLYTSSSLIGLNDG